MSPLDAIAAWPVAHAAAATIGPHAELDSAGDIDREFPLASVTKPLTAMAFLVAHEEGSLDLDAPLPPAGATTADLLAHAGGIAPDRPEPMAAVGSRRIYSTAAYDLLADELARRTGIAFADYLHEAVCGPLGMTATRLEGSAGAGAHSTVRDLAQLTEAWRAPLLVHPATLERATTPHLPDLAGVLPGFGRQVPNPWGLGPEIRGAKTPHWTGRHNAPTTFGHFGQSGTMLWIDPVADRILIALTDEPFGTWAAAAWPSLSDRVLGAGPNDPPS